MSAPPTSQQLLRYAELAARRARKIATEAELVEIEKIVADSGMSEDEVLRLAEKETHERL